MVLLDETARKVRADIIEMIGHAGSGHPGGSLSCTDLLVTLFFSELDHEKDRFILSKGHAAPTLYAVMSRAGLIPSEEDLNGLRKFGSIFQGHPDKQFLPQITMSSGSLGMGLSVGNGLAIAYKRTEPASRVYVLVGDGEIQEGQIWEAAMTSTRYGLDNLCLMIDYNGLQVDGFVKDVMPLEPLGAKWEAFNWNVIEINGHSIEEIQAAFKSARKATGKPTVIVANTIKGKGVSYMEDNCGFHAACLSEEQTDKALEDIKECKES
jgi:transketolase